MGFGQAVKTCFRKYADFHGRARRSEFWYWDLFVFLLIIAGFVAKAVMNAVLGAFLAKIVIAIVLLVAGLVLVVPSLAVHIRRLHDTNSSGWWYLLALIPYLGGLILIVWYCFKGTEGENRFGPDPLNPNTVEAFD
jgi:uncharacterized membrane protein YhaH (DUF805 family)